MRRSGRIGALGLLAAIVLLANGYPALVAHTLIAGPRVLAEVTSCHTNSKGSTSCKGQWTNSEGTSESGDITGAGTFDLHHDIPIRTGPLGAYTDNLHAHLWIRTIFAVGVDGALLGVAILMLRIRRRAPAALARLRAVGDAADVYAVGSNAIRVHDGPELFAVADAGRAQMRFLDPSGVERWRLSGEDVAGGAVLTLTEPSGTVAGYIRSEASTQAINLLDAGGEHLARVVYERVYGVPGVRFVDGAGNQPVVGISIWGRMVLRADPETPQTLRVLVFACLQGAGWLALSRFRRKKRKREPATRTRN